MSSEWDQTCLVCGIKTENRCSSCAKAGIDLFFCSTDHQKLVWKAHRRVCGPDKANPFIWPPLSQLEADEILAHMHDSTGVLSTREQPGKSVAATLCSVFPDLAIGRLPHLVETLRMGAPRSNDADLRSQQLALGLIRALEHMRQAIPRGDGTYVAPYLDPITTTAFEELTSLGSNGFAEENWRSKYRHLILAQRFLLDLWDRTDGQAPPVEWFDRIFLRYQDFLRAKVVPTCPAAEELLTNAPASEILAKRISFRGRRA